MTPAPLDLLLTKRCGGDVHAAEQLAFEQPPAAPSDHQP
jgi:hypothetical protein